MHPAQRLSLDRVPQWMGWKTFCLASGMDSTRDIRTSRGGRLACSTVAPWRERDDRCLSPRRAFSSAPIDPGSARFPFSSVSGLFDRAVGTICESPRTGRRTSRSRYYHHRCACTTWLSDRCCTAMLISVRDWQKNTHLRDRRTCNVKDEMRNMEYETLQVQTPTNTIELAITIKKVDEHSTKISCDLLTPITHTEIWFPVVYFGRPKCRVNKRTI